MVVYQFVHKMTASEILKSEKIGPPWSPGMQEYGKSILRSMEYSQNT